jgi:alpha/beta superfamily hydrolase
MQFPVETKPALWGMLGGAIALAVVGFSWGGWVTGGKAEATATDRASAAVVAALAPVCVDRFKHSDNASANLSELKGLDSWKQSEFVQKGGWATMPGAKEPDSSVAGACVRLLVDA